MFAAKNELFTTPSGYQIQRSLRFRSSASAYLSRTPGGAGNLQKFTWSGWVKRGKLASYTPIFCSNGGNTTDSNFFMVQWLNTDTIAISGALTDWRITTQVFRDPSAWYHIVFAVDTTLATAANRILLYINGIQVTAFGTSSNPTQNLNTAVNNTNAHYISTFNGSGNPSDMYLAEVNFIDGQALTPSSFGSTNATTGVWSATRYNGTYGTNGFYLNFTDNSAATAATIGKDYSGNGNNWTPNNISVTAGATYDSMLDAPLGAGGGERGNYSTLNPLDYVAAAFSGTASNGNLTVSIPAPTNSNGIASTIRVVSGGQSKFYVESTVTAVCTFCSLGMISGTNSSYRLRHTADITFAVNDVIMTAFDPATGKLWYGRNGSWLSSGDPAAGTNQWDTIPSANIPGSSFCVLATSGSTGTFTTNNNFGQQPFSYTPPTGFKALHTGNLGAPVIALPAQNMAATLYTGNSGTQTISNANNGVSFAPDFTWLKVRNDAQNHRLFDTVRGANKRLMSSSTAAEATTTDELTAFTSTGFTLGANTDVNGTGFTYVGWNWKAGGTAVSNTAGSITSSVSANTSAGFSVVTYTGTAANATVGHGLGVAPSMVIAKRRNAATDWFVWHISIPNTDYLQLNTTVAKGTLTTLWNSTSPTSTVISLGSSSAVNGGTDTQLIYAFAPVAGYSAFGSYTGNGSADGPFVYTGFRPRFLVFKRTDSAGDWWMYDTSRSTYNTAVLVLYANTSAAEISDSNVDILSNGFKLRSATYQPNNSGGTYIYMAFAENPFKYANAR